MNAKLPLVAAALIGLAGLTGCETLQMNYNNPGGPAGLGYEAPANPDEPVVRRTTTNGGPSGYDPSSDLTDTIERLQRENERLRTENARLRDSLRNAGG